MNDRINIEERKPIWIALSEFYLDTELQESDFRHIAFKIIESPYSIDEVKDINKYEVFPVLQPNLLSVVGEWAGFDKEWLISSILDSLAKRNVIKKLGIESSFLTLKWMQKNYWEKLEKVYNQVKTNPDSFILTCKEIWKNGIEPFEFQQKDAQLFERLKGIAASFKEQNRLTAFYQYLQEGQYWINLWTAYFLLELFELKDSDKLIGLNDNEKIFDFCLNEVEQNQQYLKTEQAKVNCRNWIENKKTAYNKTYEQ
ncbi:MAG: hypothetical protein JWN56_64 [Sphingobacteriales bacterium]|nr:hypothetical protein [Sphingobacteriales bacterium]